MLFRVRCVERSTGAEGERVYRAETADQAAQMAMREGYIVGQVRPEPGATAAPPPSGRLAAYTMQAKKDAERPKGLAAFFSFEYLVFPGVIRTGFAVLTAITIVATLAAPIVWLRYAQDHSLASVSALLLIMLSFWVWLAAARLVAELWIVFFAIYEQVADVRRRLAERDGRP